jgi:YihY family inner membrane protein
MHGTALRSRPSIIGPLLGSAVLVGAMFAAEIGRLYRVQERQPSDHKGLSRSPEVPKAGQRGRALQPGRGRNAVTPWQIPLKGWKDILWRTYERIGEDRLLAVAAGVVFYGLLALFPAVTAMVSLYGLFAKASTINEHLSAVAGLLPEGGVSIVRDQVDRLAAKGDAKLGLGFVIGLAIALWSANSGMKAILDALNVVYEEREKRGFIKLTLISFCFTLAAIAAVLLALGAVVIMPIALNYTGLYAATDYLLRTLRWPVLLAMIILSLGVLYRVRSQPTRAALAMDQRRQRYGGSCLGCGIRAAILVPNLLCQLRRHLWIARRRHRLDDVDVGLFNRHTVRSRA